MTRKENGSTNPFIKFIKLIWKVVVFLVLFFGITMLLSLLFDKGRNISNITILVALAATLITMNRKKTLSIFTKRTAEEISLMKT